MSTKQSGMGAQAAHFLTHKILSDITNTFTRVESTTE